MFSLVLYGSRFVGTSDHFVLFCLLLFIFQILTIFLYLNDVEEGGETRFTDLDPPLKVKPKLGRAVLWASVKDEDPFAKDPRTHHDAMKVIQGVKYGANAWFHLRDTQGAIAIGCGA